MIDKPNYRKHLTPEQYEICWNKGTEPPFSGQYHDCKDKGIYKCVCCGNSLFTSDTKFNSGTGWPSFWAPLDRAVGTTRDWSLGMPRTAVHCRRCGGHLGHVFDDGPKPTGLRYCMNGVALTFKPSTS